MADVDLLGTADAMIWAEEFVKTLRENPATADPHDESFMVTWFANAMAAQEIALNGVLDADECLTLLWACEGCGRTWEMEMPGYPGTTLGGYHWHTLPGDPGGERNRCEGPMRAVVTLPDEEMRGS